MKRLLCNLLLVCIVAFNSYAQNRTVKGKVTDDRGAPIPGVTVTVKSTTQRTSTDVDGNYNLKVDAPNAILVFSHIGLTSQEIPVTKKFVIDVKLSEKVAGLNEVVVTALNISREKRSLGYSEQGVNVDELTEARAPNITDLLDGKVAGLQITTSGQSTGSTRVIIRGPNSLTGNNQPLWVVDGVPIDNTDSNGQVGNLDYGNNAADLNPDDIASIVVLKGPNAAALYGSKAANGAILVTTKKGKKGAGLGISVNSNYMFSRVLQFPDFQNIYGEGGNDVMSGNKVGAVLGQQLYQEGSNGRSWGAPMLGQPILNFQGTQVTTYSPHPDNVTSLYHTSYSATQNIALSQADSISSIRFSYTRLDANDVVQNQNLQVKNNLQLNAGRFFGKNLLIETRIQYVKEQINNRTYRNEDPANPLNYYNNSLRNVALSDLIPWKDANGNAFTNNGIGGYENPYWDIYENANQDIHNTIIGGVTATYTIFRDLKFRAQESANLLWGNRFTFIQKGSLSNKPGAYSEFQQNNQTWNTEGLFMYNKHLKDFSISANLGGNLRSSNYYNTQASIVALAVHDVKSLANNAGLVTAQESLVRSEINSVYGTASVGYKDYLFFDLTGRNDWSSTLPPSNQSFFYPSASLSFVFTDFFKIPTNILSFGKVRASIARVGNDTSPYNLFSEFNYGGNFNGMTYVQFDQTLKNSHLKPEQTTSTEFGLELKLLNNRISIDGDVYSSKSINQILSGATPASFGYSSQIINAGEISNKGFELTVNATPIRNGNFSWDLLANFSVNRNLVVALSPGLTQLQLGAASLVTVNAVVGQPLGVLEGKNQAYSSNGVPLIIPSSGLPYTVQNAHIGNYNPRALGSFGSTFRYKSISLNFLVSGRLGGQLFSGTEYRATTSGATSQTLGGRQEWELSNVILGESGNAVTLGTTSLYNLPYPAASRQKGEMYPGYYPVLGSNGQPVLDSKGNMIPNLSAPNTRYIIPQVYWQQTSNDTHLLVYDATYAKLKQVIISYTIPQSFIRKTMFRSAVLSLVGRNLWTIYQKTPRGIDPESAAFSGNAQGVEQGGALPYASYGVDLKFSL
ncbi:MAG: SusC/RagA family TonB-linked outer membrane protein [Mucilaginibacter sp.]|nr:SusC/RagA family TonB-linked outer membrane protein [Mucilaginibacter sp.]